MKKPRGVFYPRKKNSCIEIWLGIPDDAESELVCVIDEVYLLDFIAALTALKAET